MYASIRRSPDEQQHSLLICQLRFDQTGLALARLKQEVSQTRHLILLLQTFPSAIEACSAFTCVTTYRLAESPYATLYTGGSDGFVAFTAAPIASGWSEPSSRAGLSPAVVQRLFTAHVK